MLEIWDYVEAVDGENRYWRDAGDASVELWRERKPVRALPCGCLSDGSHICAEHWRDEARAA